MGIPNKVNPLTGGDILPRGYIAAEFLESAGNAKIQIPFSFSLSQDEVRVEMETSISLSTSAIQREGYISGTNSLSIGQYNKQFSVTVGNGSGIESADLIVGAFYKVWCNFTGQGYSFGSGTTVWNSKVQTYNNNVLFYNLFNADLPWQTKRKWWKAYKNQELQFDLIPALDSQGQPIFYNKVDGTAYGNTGTGSFIVGMTVSQARYLCKLPIVESGTLTVSLPWEAQYDTGVQNALSIAATRGWTITVQYRDPEITTKNIPISFLESTGTQRIDAGLRYSSTDTYSQTLDLSITDKNHAGNTGVNYLGWCSVKNGTYYMLNETPNAPIGERDIIYNKFLNKERFLYVNGSEVTRHAEQYAASDIIAGIFALGNVNSAWWWETDKNIKAKLYSAKFTKNDVLARDMLPALDSTGAPCLYDLVTKQTFYNDGTGAFIAGFNTIEQSMKLATLPDVTAETDETKKSLTVSLPWEAQWDEGVQAALQVATDRGWTITVQYRDPEVTTKNIPIGFLESTGTQYIDSELVVTEETRISIEFFIVTKKSWRAIYGWRDSSNNGFYCREYDTTDQLQFVIGTYVTIQNFTPAARNSVMVDIASNKITINGKDITFNKPTFSEDKLSLYIFEHHRDIVSTAGAIMRCYYCNLTDGITERQYVPSLDKNGMPCMYDKVSKQPFYNIGTGSFIAGFNTVEQARSLAYLPDVTAETDAAKKSLTVSLPWEAQLVITGVPAALQVAADRGWTITVQYRDPEVDNAYYNKYATCTKVADMQAINADYQNDLTADGEWIYPLPELTNAQNAYYNAVNLKAFSVTELPAVTDLHDTFIGTKLERIKLNVPNLTQLFGTFYGVTTLKWAEVQLKNTYPTDMVGSFRECHSLSHVRINLDHLRSSGWLFENCQLDKDSTLHILTQLRTFTDEGTHNLSIGIHTDLQTDEEVTTAIADAEAKGWTLTVQWTGTATAAAASVSTFGLRSPAIYAKLGTVEHPDGAIENVLDWGHYVTNWEENGYQEFSSVEEANEYFNINQTEEAL